MGVLGILKDYSESTSGHGIPFVGGAKNLRIRIFWSVIFLCCLACFLYQISQLFFKLQRRERLTSVDLRFEKVDFPAVTLCNLNPFVASRAAQIPKIKGLMDAYNSAFDQTARAKRSLGGNDLHLWRCSYEDGSKYYRPFQAGDAEDPVNICICVNDNWNYMSYCALEQNWEQLHCQHENCNPDRFCGRYSETVEKSTDTIPCLCNTQLDGCYNASSMKENDTVADYLLAGVEIPQGHVEALKAYITSARNGSTVMQDTVREAIENNLTTLTTTPYPTIENPYKDKDVPDYGFVFEGIRDEFALQSKAKETLLFIAESLPPKTKVAISQQKPEFVRVCSFASDACEVEKDFVIHPDPNYGNCYTFNYDKGSNRKSTSRGGPNYGLRVMLYTDKKEYMFSSDSTGIRMEIHDQHYHPFPDAMGKSAPTGMISSFVVKLQKVMHLPPPDGDCKNTKIGSEYLYPGNYSVEGCYRSCIQHKLTQHCACGSPRFPQVPGGKACDAENVHGRRCLTQQSERVADGDACKCPSPCNNVQFSTGFSASNWPSSTMKLSACDPPDNATCLDHFRENAAVIEVYFEQLNYQLFTESLAYAWPNLVADLGGNIGLWLGASVITCIEFALLIIRLLGYGVNDCMDNSGNMDVDSTSDKASSLP